MSNETRSRTVPLKIFNFGLSLIIFFLWANCAKNERLVVVRFGRKQGQHNILPLLPAPRLQVTGEGWLTQEWHALGGLPHISLWNGNSRSTGTLLLYKQEWLFCEDKHMTFSIDYRCSDNVSYKIPCVWKRKLYILVPVLKGKITCQNDLSYFLISLLQG